MSQPIETAKTVEAQQQWTKLTLPEADCAQHDFKHAWLKIGEAQCELHLVIDPIRNLIKGSPQTLQNIAILHAEGKLPGQNADPHEIEVATSTLGVVLIKDSRLPSPSIKGVDTMGVVAPDHPLYKAFVALACETVGLFAPYVPQEQKAVFETMQTSLVQRNAVLNPPEAGK